MDKKDIRTTDKKIWETPALVDIRKEVILGAGGAGVDGALELT